MTEHEIFQAVLDLPNAASRAEYLDSACAGDPARRAAIDALLRSHESSDSFLGTPAAEVPDPADGQTTAFSIAAAPVSARSNGSPPHLDQDDELQAFLSPPTRSDSLGRIGHYEVLQVLGRGGFGVVFRAFDDVLQRVVAVKMMAPQMAATSPARKRFLREARASAAVRHENVVQVYEVGEQPLPYLVMEFIPGETLQNRIDRHGPLEVAETLQIGRQIAEGLAAAHLCDLIHRDIKPGNVLLESGAQRVKITDFGLARAADDASMTQSGVIAGTPLYMAPEQALGQTLDQRADLFSFGSVLYQMVTGRPPFRANNTLAVMKRVAEDTPRPIREIIPETPQWLSDIISKLHAKKPEDRFRSAREVADVLADCEAQLKANSRLRDFSLIPRGATRRAPGRRRKWLAAAAAAVVLLPLIVLAVTEMAGVTHLVRARPAAPDQSQAAGASVLPVKDAPRPAPAGQWVPLFNGKDLTGWTTAPEQPGDWKVDGGVLVGSAAQSYLFSDGTFGDFHLRAEAKIGYGGDSGVFVRSPFALRPGRNAGQFRPAGGYEVEFQENPAYPRTGSVWDGETAGPPKVLQMTTGKPLPLKDEWCTLEIIARGNRIVSMVNGVQTADCGDPRTGYPAGRIVLQVYTPQTVVRFRKIEIRELPAAAPAMSEPPPVAVAPFDSAQAKQHQDAWAGHLGVPVDFTNSIGMTFRLMPPGEFLMGAADQDSKVDMPGMDTPSTPQHVVRLTGAYFAGVHEVTVGQFRAYTEATKNVTEAESTGLGAWQWDAGEAKLTRRPALTWRTPGMETGDRFPVTCVTAQDAARFCEWLSQKEGRTYRLPTEAEWEYMCRAGTTSPFAYGAELTGDQAVFRSGAGAKEVGGREANAFGLFDVHGNASEWCDEGPRAYAAEAMADPKGSAGSQRVKRGGDFNNGAIPSWGRSFRKDDYASWGTGFRVVLVDRLPRTGPADTAKPAWLPATFKNGLGMEFMIVPKGKSWLWGARGKLGIKDVEIPADFYLGKYEVTQEEWAKVMGENPSRFSRTGGREDAVKDVSDADLKRFPVEYVSWDQCQAFVAKLNEQEKESGWVYRLPKSSEWEYACRGGPMSDKLDSAFEYYFGTPTNTLLPEQANHNKGLGRTCKVGTYEPNKLGLYDMHGNVWEWCDDEVKADSAPTQRMVHGGSWYDVAGGCQAAYRPSSAPALRNDMRGLRLARVPAGTPSSEGPLPAAVAAFDAAQAKARLEAWEKHFDPTFNKVWPPETIAGFRNQVDQDSTHHNNAYRLLILLAYRNDAEGHLAYRKKHLGQFPKFEDWGPHNKESVAALAGRSLRASLLLPLPEEELKPLAGLAELVRKSPGPGNAALQSLGLLEYRAGRFADAARLSEESLRGIVIKSTEPWVEPQSAHVGFQLAMAQARSGNLADARETYQQAEQRMISASDRIGTDEKIELVFHDWVMAVVAWREALGVLGPLEAATAAPAVAPFTDADAKRIAALPAAEQVEEVRKELIKRNSGFDGEVGHKVKDGVVTEFRIMTDHVTDISPIRVFNALRLLECRGTWGGKPNGLLTDLTPLGGMNLIGLTHLDFECTKVTDEGMVYFKDCKNLTTLCLAGTKLTEKGLANFKDCKNLKLLRLDTTKVGDADLIHFQDCKDLTYLNLDYTRVSDAGLIQFKDCKGLASLYLAGTAVSDAGLANFKAMPLTSLKIYRTGVTDLTPLQGMPLEEIRLTPKNITRGLDILRGMKSLKTIGIDYNQAWPAAEFWELYDKGELP